MVPKSRNYCISQESYKAKHADKDIKRERERERAGEEMKEKKGDHGMRTRDRRGWVRPGVIKEKIHNEL